LDTKLYIATFIVYTEASEAKVQKFK